MTRKEKQLQEELKIQKHNTHTVKYLGDCIVEIQDKKIAELKKCLGDVVYMTENGLHTKNELAFARIIAKAKELCKE